MDVLPRRVTHPRASCKTPRLLMDTRASPLRPRGRGSAPVAAAAGLNPLIPGETGAAAAVPAGMGTGTLAGDGAAWQRCQLQAPIPDERVERDG